MTLSRRLSITLTALVACLVLLAGTALIGMLRIRADVKELLSEHRELRLIDTVSNDISEVSGALRDDLVDEDFVAARLRDAEATAGLFLAHQHEELHPDPAHGEREMLLMSSILKDIETLQSSFSASFSGQIPFTREEARARVTSLLERLNTLAEETLEAVKHARHDAGYATRWTLLITLGVAAAVIIGAVGGGISQYRAVTGQLQRLRDGVQGLTDRQFRQSLPIDGDAEFAKLAGDFNHMADELRTLYETLETQVNQKTRELVRSERLASVGFLAAGVAHEINNPLSIISTYAELSLRDLKPLPSSPPVDEVRESLRIMHEEAYRCKGIIEKLMSLARGDDSIRGPVRPARIVRDVAALVSKLPKYRERELLVDVAGVEDLDIVANDAELRQVLLNLTANALEAVAPGVGRVAIRCRRLDDAVQIVVADNGSGMDKATMDHIFEPFFTTKRSDSGRGMGLGLSISHAIVTNHGGRLWAESDGPGRGSRFMVELPLRAAARAAAAPPTPEVTHV